MRTVFLSHAAVDKPVASLLRSGLEERTSDTSIFLSTRPGHIPAGSDWWRVIQNRLRSSIEYIILLTPNSITRPWILFETGAAWMSERPMFVVAASDLDKSSVPAPLSFFQVSSLEDSGELEAFLNHFGASTHELEVFRSALVDAGAGTARLDSWSGVHVGNRYFAWDGPTLHALKDRPAIPTPDDLTEAIRATGLTPSYGLPHKLEAAFGRGRLQVFETDRKSWRREIRGVAGEQVLLVHSGEA